MLGDALSEKLGCDNVLYVQKLTSTEEIFENACGDAGLLAASIAMLKMNMPILT